MKLQSRIARALKHIEIPDEQLPIVRGEQIAAFKKALPFGVAATLLNTCVVMAYVLIYGTGLTTNMYIWSGIMLTLILFAVPASIKAYKSQKAVFARPAKDLVPPVFSASMIGMSWGLAPILLMPNAPSMQQWLLTTVCAGMMCGGAYIFSTVPKAAAAFVGLIAAGFSIAVLITSMTTGKFAMVMLLATYCMIMCFAAFWNYSNHVQAWLQKIELNTQKAELGRQNEVINLLLKDFEQTASDCLWETNEEAKLIRLNADLAERLNIDPKTVMPHNFADLITRGGADEHDVARIFRTAAVQDFFRDYIIRIQTETGDRWLSFSGKRKKDGGYRGVVADITDAQEAEAKIRHLAHYDGLTNLANRELLKMELDKAINTLNTTGEGFAMICLDLDRFKIINDAHGHLVGDEVLAIAADRMLNCLGDTGIASRVGGDEFTILQRTGGTEKHATQLASSLIKAIEEPIIIDDLTVQVSTSIGISLSPHHGETAHELLKNADLALYRAKQSGRAQMCIFEQDMDDEAIKRRAIESDLREAIREGQFRLFFQPLVDGETRQAVGFEALLRWQHPKHGMVSPEEFIGVAEKTGMISTIGEWVIREALKEAALWTDEQSVSVNLSPLQVKSPTLMSCVINALATTGVDPKRLEFEITESVLLDESDNSLKTLREFHDMGIRISLDDFGTGYSSLSYLSSFPFDKIKIDKSFVQSIGDSTECRAIVRAVAGLAGSLGIRSTAEGLETEEQIASVMAEGCSELQGFFFSRPQTARTLEESGLLRRKSNGDESGATSEKIYDVVGKGRMAEHASDKTNDDLKQNKTGS